jgi:hypothetical protein
LKRDSIVIEHWLKQIVLARGILGPACWKPLSLVPRCELMLVSTCDCSSAPSRRLTGLK